jgi:hypothetical protein
MNEERFHLLVEKCVDGSLSEDEARELLEAPRERLLAEVSMAGLLARAGRPAGDLAEKVQAALRGRADKEAMVESVLHRLPARRRRRLALPVAAAAVLAIALGAWLFLRPQPPAPLASPAPADPAVREALARAVDFLRKSEVPHGPWNGPVPAEELVLLALSHAGVSPDDPHFAALLAKSLARKPERTYTVSLQAVLLERLDRARYRDRLAECARWLADNQARNGQWAYTTPAPVLDRKNRAGEGAGNNSCALFAAMGLRAAADAGIAIPRETVVRARDAWRALQRPDRDVEFGKDRAGWCYSRDEEEHHPYGSMTAGGLAALITLDHLAGDDWRKDPAVGKALRWLDFHFTVHENYGPVEDLMAKEILSDTPAPSTEYYYYLWALERACTLSGTERFRTRDWYAEGTQELLALQRKDGSWSSGVRRCNPVWDTCYAILFLTRSTRPLGR